MEDNMTTCNELIFNLFYLYLCFMCGVELCKVTDALLFFSKFSINTLSLFKSPIFDPTTLEVSFVLASSGLQVALFYSLLVIIGYLPAHVGCYPKLRRLKNQESRFLNHIHNLDVLTHSH